MEDLWHEEAKRNTLLSRSAKPMTSRKAIKSAALAAKNGTRCMGDGKQIRQGRPEEGRGRSRKKAKQIKFPQRRKKGRPKVEWPKVAHDPQITRKRSG